jgi:ABC-type multidrug transport system ATPase subunit
VIAIDRITLAYDDRVVLSDFSLQAGAGHAVALRGRNGAGKSTLLRCVAGLLKPREGTVLVADRIVDETSAHFRRTVAALLDDAAWYPSLTVMEHVGLVRMVNGLSVDAWWDPAELTDRLDLASIADDSPARLSSGQRQRLALAMTFARPSELLLLDEPERHLDAAGRAAVTDLITKYTDRGGAALIATHDPVLAGACHIVDLNDPVSPTGADQDTQPPAEPAKPMGHPHEEPR